MRLMQVINLIGWITALSLKPPFTKSLTIYLPIYLSILSVHLLILGLLGDPRIHASTHPFIHPSILFDKENILASVTLVETDSLVFFCP